uniref:Galectin n=1 Tax=Bos indicus x Bos taurus TaxID=30522 RepID=A0A4W2CEB8_BOBOX
MVKIMGNLESSCGKNPELVVDFCTGIEEDSDIAFHFRVYTNSMVVMNSFQKGGWQEEKRMFSDPFMPGQPFELRFLVLENEYKPNPYQQSVSLAVGFMVKIMGNLESSCGKNPELVVDFCTGIEEDSDIAFHFRVYTNSMVVMNSFQKGGWQEEKRMFSDPFMPGQPFELRFLVLENEYKVFVNNESFCQFAHRLPLQSVKMLKVKGDTVLTSVDTF